MAKLNLESSSSVLGNFEVKSPDEIAAEKLEQERIAAKKKKAAEERRKREEANRLEREKILNKQKNHFNVRILLNNLAGIGAVMIGKHYGYYDFSEFNLFRLLPICIIVLIVLCCIFRVSSLHEAKTFIDETKELVDEEKSGISFSLASSATVVLYVFLAVCIFVTVLVKD